MNGKKADETKEHKILVSSLNDDYSRIRTGDMPGDKVQINDNHVIKATTLFKALLNYEPELYGIQSGSKYVFSVYGGSGVGKSEIGSLLAYYFNEMSIGTYILSGDNYPHRIPKNNDAERIRIFREHGIKGMVKEKVYSEKKHKIISELQATDRDSDKALAEKYPWLLLYQSYGEKGLANYLGTQSEIDFNEISMIIKAFKEGDENIFLKRMGRREEELWYESVSFSDIKILIIEWTHGNNDLLQGIDIPILLNSTPAETLAHRQMRNRDGGTDSPFTKMVLSIEQELLMSQVDTAKMILSKDGSLISHTQLHKLMH